MMWLMKERKRYFNKSALRYIYFLEDWQRTQEKKVTMK